MENTSKLTGSALIADYVSRLPGKPGVYRMIGDDGIILYVGKARSLKNRVASYAKPTGHSNRIMRMIAQTIAMEFVVTESETESLLLEANLIKQLKPKYNVLLRDDKSFPYILIATDHDAPQIIKHRGARKRQGHYFGPFASAGAVNQTINTLQKAFLLRNCSDNIFDGRTRPCLLHQIKRCAAPCTGEISTTDYQKLVTEAEQFLHGKNADIQAALSQDMEYAAAQLDFEKAASLRDRIKALTFVQESQGINPNTVVDADLFAIHISGGQACIQSFFFRAGQNWGNHAWYPRHDKEEPTSKILSAFIAQFYDNRTPASTILVSETLEDAELLQEALSLHTNRKVTIVHPQRGEKRELIAQARMNAREALSRKLSETATQQKLLKGLAQAIGMDTPPKRIEVYDNSHISGTNALGAMIVAGEDGFLKNQYRKFNIKNKEITPGDDFGMMKEVITRRFSRLVNKETPASDNWPDLVIIDGGRGQLNIVKQAMEDTGITIGPDNEAGEIMLISVAKGRREMESGEKRVDRTMGAEGEQFFLPGKEVFTLPPREPSLYFLQRLRDEAHRFAIGSHRAKRRQQISKNPLDNIEGIGAKRKKALLHHFGSAKAVARAKMDDLIVVEGISAAIAERIYNHFNDNKHNA